MKKIMTGMILLLFTVAAVFMYASAADNSSSFSLQDEIESAIQQSPEVSSMLDDAENGVSIDPSALTDALGRIEGLDMDTILQGLEGLDEDDGLLGKLASLIGPESDGFGGVISDIGSGLGNLFGGLGGNGENPLEGLLNGLGNLGNNATTEAPTVHTTAQSYNQSVTLPQQYTPNYNTGSSGGVITYNQYTATYTLPAQIPTGEVTTQTYTVPSTTTPMYSVALPADGETDSSQESNTNWKKILGAILVFGSFAGVAAVVIKKSM